MLFNLHHQVFISLIAGGEADDVEVGIGDVGGNLADHYVVHH
jgi:hypothetical protein